MYVSPKQLYSDICESPIGEICIVADGNELCFLDFMENEARRKKLLKRRFGAYQKTTDINVLGMRDRLKRYFDGDWSAFQDLSISKSGTEFQRSVWEALTRIPVGSAISYHRLAMECRNPAAIRAAASANANNPVAIVVPCHRVIGKDGTVRGYAGGEERKAWLLRHEGVSI